MKRILGIGGIVVGALLLMTFVVLYLLPGDYAVERSRIVNAPAGHVFEQVIELRNHAAWSPWRARDETMVFTYSEPSRGDGAYYEWTSDNSGDGKYEITNSQTEIAIRRIETKITFIGMGSSDGWWTFEPQGDKTNVTWGFKGTNSGIFGGLFSALMDPLVGADFEDGLARLAVVAENPPHSPDTEPSPPDTDQEPTVSP